MEKVTLVRWRRVKNTRMKINQGIQFTYSFLLLNLNSLIHVLVQFLIVSSLPLCLSLTLCLFFSYSLIQIVFSIYLTLPPFLPPSLPLLFTYLPTDQSMYSKPSCHYLYPCLTISVTVDQICISLCKRY